MGRVILVAVKDFLRNAKMKIKRLGDLQEGDCFYFDPPVSTNVYQYWFDHIRLVGYTLLQEKQFVPVLQEDIENFNVHAMVRVLNLFAEEK